MNELNFWEIIAQAKQRRASSDESPEEALRHCLQNLPINEILEFDRLFHVYLNRSYSWDLWAAAYIINGGCSDDGFDYFRAWLIAQGQTIFENALRDPETLVDIAEPDAEAEAVMYVAREVYEAKFGHSFPDTSYPAAELTGEEWEETDAALAAKYPKLFARFGQSPSESEDHTEMPDLSQLASFLGNMAGVTQESSTDANALYTQAAFLALTESSENLAKAAELLTKAADLGHAGAQNMLGTFYEAGQGVPQNFIEAERLYRLAAGQGEPDAFCCLGNLYSQGVGVPQDNATAFQWYQKGAEAGSADAQCLLANAYYDGAGVEKNLPQALHWFCQAGENGHGLAAKNAGICYLNGNGTEPDAEQAFHWFSVGAENGDATSRFNLGVMYEHGQGTEQDFEKAAEMYEQAISEGSTDALINLGKLYADGLGVAQDHPKAAELYRQAADSGNLAALCNLGVLYQTGRGVPQDVAEAVRLQRQCAEAGYVGGQYNLGTLYQRGIGVEKDLAEALKWYRLATEQGSGPAMNNLGDAYENGYGVQKDYTEAAQWYRSAAEKGVGVAQYSLGLFYRDGLGVAQDYPEAEKWLRQAIANGVEKAQTDLDQIYESGFLTRPAESVTKIASTPKKKPAPADSKAKTVAAMAAAQRALCLRAMICRSVVEAKLQCLQANPGMAGHVNPDQLNQDARHINEWLANESLWHCLSAKEKNLLNAKPGTWKPQAVKDASWRLEALEVISWALGWGQSIAPYDQQINSESFELGSPTFPATHALIDAAHLRPEAEILQAREIAEAWLWRARTTRIQKGPEAQPAPEGWTYEKIIAETARHWEKIGAFKALDGDYPALGKPYRDLTPSEWETLNSIATERLYGLNWICLQAKDWDHVPVNT